MNPETIAAVVMIVATLLKGIGVCLMLWAFRRLIWKDKLK